MKKRHSGDFPQCAGRRRRVGVLCSSARGGQVQAHVLVVLVQPPHVLAEACCGVLCSSARGGACCGVLCSSARGGHLRAERRKRLVD